MTQELIDNLIDHYEKVIAKINSSECTYKSAKDLIYSQEVFSGICYCAAHVFNADIYNDKWAKSIHWDYYGGITPDSCISIAGIISALQLRVDIMKTFKE